MAYNTGERFPRPPKAYRILEPGAYEIVKSVIEKPNNAPFLSKTARNTGPGNRIWTHAIYYTDIRPKIPNCSSIKSKLPRFPYEAFSKEDLEAILCKCGIQSVCECVEEDEEQPEEICQAKVQRRLYVGHPPRSAIADGLSAPSKNDHGFEIMSDGTVKRKFCIKKEQSPPFYDATVIESTAFYQGCKWSQWKSTRATKSLEEMPGPADYTIERHPTDEEICAENVRHEKRKSSKLLRFIEMLQHRELSEGRPGPASYSPKYPPRSSDLENIGPKTDRFPESFVEQRPGPADHWIRRDFDIPDCIYTCHAKLPEPSCFGVKALRFKHRKEEGPSPATYSPISKHCHFMHCPTAGFGSSSVRFKDTLFEEDELVDEPDRDEIKETQEICPKPTWEFKSKTIRIHPLKKKPFEPSPADLPMSITNVERSDRLQYMAPFGSSELRFNPWYDWMPIVGRLETPGPSYYNLEKPKCLPAVCRGPLVRSERFPTKMSATPAPNEYKVGGGVETLLATHNERLKSNIISKHEYHWEQPIQPRQLSIEERDTLLLNKCIALCEPDGKIPTPSRREDSEKRQSQTKLLRCFLYSHPMKSSI